MAQVLVLTPLNWPVTLGKHQGHVPRQTEGKTELCGQEVSWGALLGSALLVGEEKRVTRQKRKLGCDAATTMAPTGSSGASGDLQSCPKLW